MITPEGKLVKLPIHRLGVERKAVKGKTGAMAEIKARVAEAVVKV